MTVETLEHEFFKAKNMHMVRVVREYLTQKKMEYKKPEVLELPKFLNEIQVASEVTTEISNLINNGEFYNKYNEAWYFLTEQN